MSTSEAEYGAVSECVKEVKWIRRVLEAFGCKHNEPTILYEDNQACMEWATERTPAKQIDIRINFSRQAVEDGDIELKYCRTEDMVADIVTKTLSDESFERLRNEIGVQSS